MILPLSLLFAAIICVVLCIINFKKYWILFVLGAIIFLFGGVLSFTIPFQNNPEPGTFYNLKIQYDFILNTKNTPFVIKKELYQNCYDFNRQLYYNVKYSDNIFIGYYYPKITDKNIAFFGLSKIQ